MDHVSEVANNTPRLAYKIEALPAMTGVNRGKIFAAIKAGELMARKVGRSTIIEHDELKRWLKTLPIRGRQPEAA